VRFLLALPFALLVTACGSEPEGGSAEETMNPPLPPQSPVDDALTEIPPAERRNFQKAIMCEVQRSTGEAIDVTPEYIRDLRQRLADDPSLAEC
tara:strand:- start:167 stop:448 length:282 start_codon:yes stop_codon:yes gene_type:complete